MKSMDAIIQKTLKRSRSNVRKVLPNELKKHVVKENEKMCLLEAFRLSKENCECCGKPSEAEFLFVAFIKKDSSFFENHDKTPYYSHVSLCKERNIGFNDIMYACDCKQLSFSNSKIPCLKEQGGITKNRKIRVTVFSNKKGEKKKALRQFDNKAIIPIEEGNLLFEIKDDKYILSEIDKLLIKEDSGKVRVKEIFRCSTNKEEKLEAFLKENSNLKNLVEAAKYRATFKANEKIKSYSFIESVK